jgi:G:T/U-mismatch repair DNA glycosylase
MFKFYLFSIVTENELSQPDDYEIIDLNNREIAEAAEIEKKAEEEKQEERKLIEEFDAYSQYIDFNETQELMRGFLVAEEGKK